MGDLKQRIVLSFDPITRDLAIEENEFTTFEAFGILEAAKHMIAKNWLGDDES